METATKPHVTVNDALSRLESASLFVEVFKHGTLSVEMYAPEGHDAQTPHSRDEVYVVARGQGQFVNGEDQHSFSAGDFIFVPAGVVHRFENFSEDFAVWVLFYGPEGGEHV